MCRSSKRSKKQQKNKKLPAGKNEKLDSKLQGTRLDDEICLKGVTPECFYRGSSFGTRLDSRLGHAGMTDFG